MKVGLLPLFIPHQALDDPQSLDPGSIALFSSVLITELTAYIKSKFSDIDCRTFFTLSEILKAEPDLVLILSNSADFNAVSDWAHQLKATLSCAVWLAGSHISYTPQTLPHEVDLGILGEIEVPLYQLLTLALKAGGLPFLTPQMYRKVPGIIYQSHGRMYSGSPAQEIPELKQMASPDLGALSALPGYFASSIRTARINDSIFSQLAFPPTRKPRLYSVDYVCENMVSVVQHHKRFLVNHSLPPAVFRQVCSVFITDYQFVLHKKRLEEIVKKIKSNYLHHVCFLTVHMPVRSVTEELLYLLKSVNLQKVVLSFGPFGHEEPLLPPANASDLDRALALLKRFRIGVTGNFFVNPESKTSRKSIFRTYSYLKANSMCFERLSCVILGSTPGLSSWDATLALRKQKYAFDLKDYPWSALHWGPPAKELVLAQKHLSVDFFDEVYKACLDLNQRTSLFVPPLHQESKMKAHAELVKSFAETHLFPEARLLEVVLDQELALKPFLKDYHEVYQLWVSDGQLTGVLPQPVDVLVTSASLHGLRNPEKALKHALLALKPGGMVFASILNPLFIGFLAQIFKWPARQSIVNYKVLKWFTDRELLRLFDICGLEIVRVDYTTAKVESLRETVEKLGRKFEHFASMQIPQHGLYIREINVIARKRKNV